MKLFISCCLAILLVGCQNHPIKQANAQQQIIEVLEKETKYFCARDLTQWQAQWSHQTFTSKMYAGNTAFEELIGWKAINQFAVQHIQNHPEPIPVPEVVINYDIHLFGETALVFYLKQTDTGSARETRFMVKESEQWRIARMQTIFLEG